MTGLCTRQWKCGALACGCSHLPLRFQLSWCRDSSRMGQAMRPSSCNAEIRGMYLIWDSKHPLYWMDGIPPAELVKEVILVAGEQGGPMGLLVWDYGHGCTNYIPSWGYTYKQQRPERTQAIHTILDGPRAAHMCVRDPKGPSRK